MNQLIRNQESGITQSSNQPIKVAMLRKRRKSGLRLRQAGRGLMPSKPKGGVDSSSPLRPNKEKAQMFTSKRVEGEVKYNDGDFAEVDTFGIEGIEKDLLLDTIQIHCEDTEDTSEEFQHRFPVGMWLSISTTTRKSHNGLLSQHRRAVLASSRLSPPGRCLHPGLEPKRGPNGIDSGSHNMEFHCAVVPAPTGRL